MSRQAAAKSVTPSPTDLADAHLRGIMYLLETEKASIPKPLLDQIKQGTINAMDVLRQQDRVAQRAATIVLILQESTLWHRKTNIRSGKVTEFLEITNPDGYRFAMALVHQPAPKA